jgi:hypothetical protein
METLEMNFRKEIAEVTKIFEDQIVWDIRHRADLTYRMIGEQYGVEEHYVCRLAFKNGIQRPRGSRNPAHPKFRRPQY